ncbi:MAG TPA: ogr/Delta-like zinc finger family protein [Gemmataceae bacterium]|nr:ogr/Delta-like zinc finger family protein [Gemmataceae bacterium]
MKGFRCPQCKGRLYVRRTLRTARGVVVRYRHCPGCGHYTRTEEREKKALKR